MDADIVDPLIAIGCADDADIRLDLAALELAAADRSRADLGPAIATMERLASRLPARRSGSAARAEALAALLVDAEGFSGDLERYDAPENADMIAVLHRRRGLPIALAILHVAVARRHGWTADILGLPGHVLVRVGGEADSTLIDPFADGRPVQPEAVREILDRALGRQARTEPQHVAALANREILVRLVMNQAVRARQNGDAARALTLYRRMTLIAPAMTPLWWERARLERLAGDTAAARKSLAAMLETTRDTVMSGRIRAAVTALAR